MDASLRRGLPVYDLGPDVEQNRINLSPSGRPETRRSVQYLGRGIAELADGDAGLADTRGRFLRSVHRQVSNAQCGVFLWNLEPYDDVTTLPESFQPPLGSLYAVASGLKPNMILHTLGMDDHTRVRVLRLQRTWAARPPPAARGVERRGFPRLRPLCVPQASAPANVLSVVGRPDTRRCGLEGHRPVVGGGDPKMGWAGGHPRASGRYRQLEHEYVVCNLLGDRSALLNRIRPEGSRRHLVEQCLLYSFQQLALYHRPASCDLRGVGPRTCTTQPSIASVRIRLQQHERKPRSRPNICPTAFRGRLRLPPAPQGELMRNQILTPTLPTREPPIESLPEDSSWRRHRGPVLCAGPIPGTDKVITSGYDGAVGRFDLRSGAVRLLRIPRSLGEPGDRERIGHLGCHLRIRLQHHPLGFKDSQACTGASRSQRRCGGLCVRQRPHWGLGLQGLAGSGVGFGTRQCAACPRRHQKDALSVNTTTGNCSPPATT